MKKIITIVLLTTALSSFANSLSDNIKKLNWNGVDIVYLEDNKYPSYYMKVYFADGALSDSKRLIGETDMMFSQLASGTERYDQKELADALEYYGSGFSTDVNPEYSTLSVSGLTKDIVPTLKMVCHTFTKAIFPKKELKKYKKRSITALKNIISSPRSLASRAFRQLSLKGTKYAHPSEGYIKTIKRINRKHLVKKLKYFQNDVKKRVYITGPSSILGNVQRILSQDCNFKGDKANFSRIASKNTDKEKKGKEIYLIPIPKSPQAEVRIGRYLDETYAGKDHDLLTFTSSYLGGGFTSKLMQRLRVKEGLTYGVYSFAGLQHSYGRAGIQTSTKNKTLEQILNSTKDVISIASDPSKITDEELKKIKGFLAGQYLFQFEESSDFLNNLLFYDHIGRNYDELYKFPEVVKSITKETLAQKVQDLYGFNKQTIVVVGDKSLVKQLSKFGKVRVISHTKVL
jgi:zinc protease